MKTLIPLIIVLLSAAAYAQSDLPDVGSIADLKGKTKVYIVADAQNTKWILKGLKDHPELVRVDHPDDAEFFLEYKETQQRQQVNSLFTMVTGQLDVYFYRDKRRVVAWSDSKVSAMKWPSLTLTEKFAKEFGGKK
jgi:hypothetical protein